MCYYAYSNHKPTADSVVDELFYGNDIDYRCQSRMDLVPQQYPHAAVLAASQNKTLQGGYLQCVFNMSQCTHLQLSNHQLLQATCTVGPCCCVGCAGCRHRLWFVKHGTTPNPHQVS